MERQTRPPHRIPLLLAVLAAVLAAGGGYAAAAGDGEDRRRAVASKVTTHAGASSKGPCKVGYDFQTGSLIPPDDGTSDNVPAAGVTFKKPCHGLVIARFSGEVTHPTAGDFLHMDLRATCIAPARTTNPCTVGQVVFGNPGHTFLQSGAAATGTRSAQWVLPALKRGRWTFEALPGGNNSASLGFRTLTVEAWTGG